MGKTEQKIRAEFGAYGCKKMDPISNEIEFGCGVWFYTDEAFSTYDEDCHTVHEDNFGDLYRELKRLEKGNGWKAKLEAQKSH